MTGTQVDRSGGTVRHSTAERLLAATQYLTDIGIWEWDIASGEVYWSDGLYRIYGLRPGEEKIDLDTFMSKVHPEDRSVVMRSVQHSLESGAQFGHNERILRPDGSVRYLETRGEAVTDGEGRGLRRTNALPSPPRTTRARFRPPLGPRGVDFAE